MIKPSPGRIVWYRYLAGEGIIGAGDDPLSAQIARVNSDTNVNLAVLGADGTWHVRPNVMLCQDDQVPQPGQACWMPFQKGQASATQAVVADAGAVHQALEAKSQQLHELLAGAEERVKNFFEQEHDKLLAAATHVENAVKQALHVPIAPPTEPPPAPQAQPQPETAAS